MTTSSGNAASRTADACVKVTRQKEFGGRFDVANSRRGRKPESAGDAGRGSWCRVGLGSIAQVWMKNEGMEAKDALSMATNNGRHNGPLGRITLWRVRAVVSD